MTLERNDLREQLRILESTAWLDETVAKYTQRHKEKERLRPEMAGKLALRRRSLRRTDPAARAGSPAICSRVTSC